LIVLSDKFYLILVYFQAGFAIKRYRLNDCQGFYSLKIKKKKQKLQECCNYLSYKKTVLHSFYCRSKQ